jgi:hypothetical protein
MLWRGPGVSSEYVFFFPEVIICYRFVLPPVHLLFESFE